MQELKTKKLFTDLIPPLSIDESGELAASIAEYGCRDAICVWDGVIVDGHNRYNICKRLGRSFRVKEMHFANDEEAVAWIIRNQFGRRNLNAAQRTSLALKLKEAIAAEAKAKQKKAGKEKLPQNFGEAKANETNAKVAAIAGVSAETVRKVEKIEREAKPEVKEAMRSGEMSINAAFKTVAPKVETPAPAPDFVVVDDDADAPTEAEIAVSESAPVKRVKNWERFANWNEAEAAFDRECGGVIMRCNWNGIGNWMYMDYIEGESRLDFLKRCKNLTAEGRKEIARLEKAAHKEASK